MGSHHVGDSVRLPPIRLGRDGLETDLMSSFGEDGLDRIEVCVDGGKGGKGEKGEKGEGGVWMRCIIVNF